MTNVKGSKITSKLSYLTNTYGDGAPAQVLSWLSEDDRKALGLVLEVGWYPQDLYVRLLTAICETVGRGDGGIYGEIGEYSADHQFNHSYRVYRASDIYQTLQNMVPVHAKLNQPSGMEVVVNEPGRATLLVTAPPSDPVICAVSRGFYRRVMELHGAGDVRVLEPSCSGRGAASCRFEIQWTPVDAPSPDAVRATGARRPPPPPEMKHD